MVQVRWLLFIGALCATTSAGCESVEPKPAVSFYDRKISPVLTQSCAGSGTRSGCHVYKDDRENAFGNLSVESYAALDKRRDLLITYGPYGMPALLAKAVPDFQLRLTRWDSSEPQIITTNIPHVGRQPIGLNSAAFTQIQRWIERGATENNSLPAEEDLRNTPCSETPGSDPLFDPAFEPTSEDYKTFRSTVNEVLGENCAAGNCHGSPSNSLYLTCGKSEEQRRWNYFAAGDYVSAAADSSELLRRSLSDSAGGTYHEGGSIFDNADDPGYRAILKWAEEKGGPTNIPTETGFLFFADRVQPMLVKKGCMLIGCHSPAMGHEYRLRGGSGSHFGLPATRRNYELSLEQLALESPDPRASRILRKNLQPPVDDPIPGAPPPVGITHRGGALFGIGNDACDLDAARTGPLDEQDPFCVLLAWFELEKEERMADAMGLTELVYVQRSARTDSDVPQAFEVFAPGADLIRAPASLLPDGSLSVTGGSSVLAQCGLDASSTDVRRPAVSWDGRRIAFSARTAAEQPWEIFVIEGGQCTREPTIAAPATDEDGRPIDSNGELIHNFDPTFTPDDRIVFTSTRGNIMNVGAFDYSGPQRTPADPSRLNANLYIAENGTVRQLTFLLNQEMTPSLMEDGRVILTAEKRAPDFYQLAGRRMNLDGGDYHPLFGQRSTVGFNQFTDVVEIADKNLVAIFSDQGAQHGAGALAVINRSIGIDQRASSEAAYLQDPDARNWQNPLFFQRSIRILDGVGRPGEGGRVYRNPSRLPNGNVLVSMANVPDVGNFNGNFDVFVVDPVTGQRMGPVVSDPQDLLWPVAVYARPPKAPSAIFRSKLAEPNGATTIVPSRGDRSEILFLDVPLLASLLFQNTRSHRVIPDSNDPLEIWESLPPEPGVKSFADGGSFVTSDDFGDLYVRRRRLGSVELEADGSARVWVPGGMPILLAPAAQLVGDSRPTRHHQREELQFYPGEIIRQGFRRNLFNGICGNCHGAVSGYESDVALNPDILTQASAVDARDVKPTDLRGKKGSVEGPPVP